MCTLSWIHSGTSLDVFFNRDERRARGPEIGPTVGNVAGVEFVAPRDSDAGGTWIGANAHGLVVALLNGYRPADRDRSTAATRGGLVLAAMAARDSEDVAARLAATELTLYRSFVLAAVRPEGRGVIATWDGAALAIDRDLTSRWPLISSSVEGAEVDRTRRGVFTALARRDAESLLAAHASHENGPSAYSVCMHRDDGETRSFTRVSVDERTVRLAWHAASPCRGVAPVVAEIARVR